jgi:hypothetical protein
MFRMITCLCTYLTVMGSSPYYVACLYYLFMNYRPLVSRDSAVCIATSYGLDDQGVQEFSQFYAVQTGSGSTQPPIQWVPGGSLFGGKVAGGVELTTHQLVPRSRKCGSIHPFYHTPSWRSA